MNITTHLTWNCSSIIFGYRRPRHIRASDKWVMSPHWWCRWLLTTNNHYLPPCCWYFSLQPKGWVPKVIDLAKKMASQPQRSLVTRDTGNWQRTPAPLSGNWRKRYMYMMMMLHALKKNVDPFLTYSITILQNNITNGSTC